MLTKFLMEAKRAATEIARLPGTEPGELVAAMAELHDNIHEHSDAPGTGTLAFRATPGVFEFVAADRGIGVLRSLTRSRRFAALPNHGKALERPSPMEAHASKAMADVVMDFAPFSLVS